MKYTTEKDEATGLLRIIAARDIPIRDVKTGDKGGLIEKEANLSQEGDAWVYRGAQVYGEARVSGEARISGKARVYGQARVYGESRISGKARISGEARVYGGAQVFDEAQVYGEAWVYGEARGFGNATIQNTKDWLCIGPVGAGRFITVTKSDRMIVAGCFRGTLDEFKAAVDRKYEGEGDYYPTISYIEHYLQ